MSVFFVATLKYFYAPLFAYGTGLSIWESVITIILGGFTSFLFFYYISHFIVISTKYVKPVAHRVTPDTWLSRYYERKERRNSKPKKKFTKRNRRIIRMRNAGVWAIILTTPVLLSLPLGAFLLRRYYDHKKGVLFFALFAIALEGVLMCLAVWHFPWLRPD